MSSDLAQRKLYKQIPEERCDHWRRFPVDDLEALPEESQCEWALVFQFTEDVLQANLTSSQPSEHSAAAGASLACYCPTVNIICWLTTNTTEQPGHRTPHATNPVSSDEDEFSSAHPNTVSRSRTPPPPSQNRARNKGKSRAPALPSPATAPAPSPAMPIKAFANLAVTPALEPVPTSDMHSFVTAALPVSVHVTLC
jgi:hypothetical protein